MSIISIAKDINNKTMTKEKAAQARNDLFAFYIGRPLSYLLTIPFLKLKVKPNTVSIISIIPVIIGFTLVGFGSTLTLKILGWLCFFFWNLLDGVDGNIARYTKQFSNTGSLLDATSGYFAMIFTFLAFGTGCYYGNFTLLEVDQALMIILGGISASLVILPRLVMHKRITSIGEDDKSSEMKDKSKYNFIKFIGLNIISISGMIQVFMLLSIIFQIMDLFTIFYFIVNVLICFVSLNKLLKEPSEKGV